MTTPRDPLVEQLRSALKDVEWGTSISDYDELFDACPQCLNRMSKGHTPQCALAAALSASAPMPAPEKPAPCGCVAGGNKCHYHNKHPQIPVKYAPERSDAAACHAACVAAGLDPAVLAADPEAIKRVVEAAVNVQSRFPQRKMMLPHILALRTALRAIGKEQV